MIIIIRTETGGMSELIGVLLLALLGWATPGATLQTLSNAWTSSDPNELLAKFLFFVLPAIVAVIYAILQRKKFTQEGKPNVPVMAIARTSILVSALALLLVFLFVSFSPNHKSPNTFFLADAVTLLLSPFLCACLVTPSAVVSSAIVGVVQYCIHVSYDTRSNHNRE